MPVKPKLYYTVISDPSGDFEGKLQYASVKHTLLDGYFPLGMILENHKGQRFRVVENSNARNKKYGRVYKHWLEAIDD